MTYSWQQSQWQKVQSQREQARLPHALLLTGPDGLGKEDFAVELASSLLCKQPQSVGEACGECAACKLLEAGTHPDLFVVQAEEAGKAIKVDEIRQLATKLNLTSQYGGYKVALVLDAHDMNINASNSLLKTLEEPADDSILILVSSKPSRLPITIRSRCQLIEFAVPEHSVAKSWLAAENIEPADLLLGLAHGAPLLARSLQQEGLLEQHQQLVSALLNVANNKPVVEQAADIHKLPLAYMLNWLYDWVQDIIKLQQCGSQAIIVNEAKRNELLQIASRCSLAGLYDYMEQLIKNKQLQSIPLNSQLLWEDLLLSWNKLLKQV